jgi:hypothetical protein
MNSDPQQHAQLAIELAGVIQCQRVVAVARERFKVEPRGHVSMLTFSASKAGPIVRQRDAGGAGGPAAAASPA